MADPRVIGVEPPAGQVCGYYETCSECGDELCRDTRDNGIHAECGNCGHEWWEGEFIRPDTDARQQEQI